MADEDEARRKEREANTVPEPPRWLWDWKLWLGAIVFGLMLYVAKKLSGN